MKKRLIKYIALILCAVIFLFPLSSCKKEKENDKDKTPTKDCLTETCETTDSVETTQTQAEISSKPPATSHKKDKNEVAPYLKQIGYIKRIYVKEPNIITGSREDGRRLYIFKDTAESLDELYLIFRSKEYYNRPAIKYDKNKIEKVVGKAQVFKHDSKTGSNYSEFENVYSVKGYDPALMVAVKIYDNYYIYLNYKSVNVKTFGEYADYLRLFEDSRLPYYRLQSFGKDGKFIEGCRYRKIDDSSKIFAILKKCLAAPIVINTEEIDKIEKTAYEKAEFYLDCEGLLEYASDGNDPLIYIFSSGYLFCGLTKTYFFIGPENAKAIIAEAKKFKKEEKMPHYNYDLSLSGTITHIDDSCFIVNDYALLKNPKDGMDFKILFSSKDQKEEFEKDFEVGSVVTVRFIGFPVNCTIENPRSIFTINFEQ